MADIKKYTLEDKAHYHEYHIEMWNYILKVAKIRSRANFNLAFAKDEWFEKNWIGDRPINNSFACAESNVNCDKCPLLSKYDKKDSGCCGGLYDRACEGSMSAITEIRDRW